MRRLGDVRRTTPAGAPASSPASTPASTSGTAPASAPGAAPSATPRTGRTFLSGATGFLGAFLLRDLLEAAGEPVECLVRARGAGDGHDRLRAALTRYGLWHPAYEDLIVPLPGDLAAPSLGLTEADLAALSRRVGTVIHNAAAVNVVAPYTALRGPNVLGTRTLLRVAADAPAGVFHHVSSTSVFAARPGAAPVVTEATAPGPVEGLAGGYGRSKWVAEGVVAAARRDGVPASVHRPARISGDTATGACQEDDLLWRFVKGCVQVGAVPVEAVENTSWVPVDHVSAGIVRLALDPDTAPGSDYHYTDPDAPGLPEVFAALRRQGFELAEVPGTRWLEQVDAQEGNVAKLLLDLRADAEREAERNAERNGPGAEETLFLPVHDSSRTAAALARVGVPAPRITVETVDLYIDYFVRTGFLPRPKG